MEKSKLKYIDYNKLPSRGGQKVWWRVHNKLPSGDLHVEIYCRILSNSPQGNLLRQTRQACTSHHQIISWICFWSNKYCYLRRTGGVHIYFQLLKQSDNQVSGYELRVYFLVYTKWITVSFKELAFPWFEIPSKSFADEAGAFVTSHCSKQGGAQIEIGKVSVLAKILKNVKHC